MCRAVKVLCVAPDRERLIALKQDVVAAEWELCPGATDLRGALDQLDVERPHAMVAFGPFEELVALDGGSLPGHADRHRSRDAGLQCGRRNGIGGPGGAAGAAPPGRSGGIGSAAPGAPAVMLHHAHGDDDVGSGVEGGPVSKPYASARDGQYLHRCW